MSSEPITLYKLMVLYMLKRVDFPLSYVQITNFFLGKEYTSYFTFQQVMSQLEESKLIHKETVRNSTRYEATKEGEEVLYYFGERISKAIREDIEEYMKKNKYKMRSENSILADYYRTSNGDYAVHCKVNEGKNVLIDLTLTAATDEMAEHMCENWNTHAQELYAHIMKTLMEKGSKNS